MSAIKLFDPSVGAIATKTPSSLNNSGAVPMLLLNILIELRVQNQYLASMNPQVTDLIENLRSDETNEGAS